MTIRNENLMRRHGADPGFRASLVAYTPSLVLLLIMVLASIYFSGLLPEQVATRFDFAGQPTEYGSRRALLMLMPMIYATTILLLPAFLRFSPQQYRFGHSARHVLPRTMTAVGVLFTSIHLGILLRSLDPKRYPPEWWLSIGLGLFMLFLGPVLEKSERNYFIGIRTPWSMASEANWQATHRFAAKLMMITGAGLLGTTLLAKPSLVIAIVSVLFAVTTPAFYSLWYYNHFENRSES